MISHSELKKGLMVEFEGQIYQVVEYQPFRHAQRAAMVKVKLKNIRGGRTVERTLQPGDKLLRVQMERRTVQYLYNDGDLYYFMDVENYEQFPITGTLLGDTVHYLYEGINVDIMSYKGELITAELPITVELKVEDTGPAHKGDTAQSGTKPAKLETGLEIKVPLFIAIGEKVKIDTRTGEYLERVT